jgi:hypothetical protein
MLVGNQNGIECGDVFADSGQALGRLAAAQASIDEDTRPPGRNEGRVPGAAASEDANLDDKDYAPLRLVIAETGTKLWGIV